MGGADWVPTCSPELDDYVLDDYVEATRPSLCVNAQTREFIDFLMTLRSCLICPGLSTAGCTASRSMPA